MSTLNIVAIVMLMSVSIRVRKYTPALFARASTLLQAFFALANSS